MSLILHVIELLAVLLICSTVGRRWWQHERDLARRVVGRTPETLDLTPISRAQR